MWIEQIRYSWFNREKMNQMKAILTAQGSSIIIQGDGQQAFSFQWSSLPCSDFIKLVIKNVITLSGYLFFFNQSMQVESCQAFPFRKK